MDKIPALDKKTVRVASSPWMIPRRKAMKKIQISKAFTLMESGPAVLVTTNDGKKAI